MDEPERPSLRTVGPTEAGTGVPAGPLQSFGVNETAELVADLISATGLLGDDRLAQVRGRATQSGGSFGQALLDEGLATGDGLARLLATRHQLPYVELVVHRHRRRRGEDDPAARLRAHRRAAVRATRRDAPDRDRRSGERARDRRAASRDAAPDRARRRGARRDPRRDQEARPRVGGFRRPRRGRAAGRPSSSRRRTRPPTSRSTTASPTRRSSGSSTRSSSRRPRTAPPTSTSSRRRTRSPSASASTACCRKCSGSRSG